MRILIISSSEGMALMLLRCMRSPGRKTYIFSVWEEEGFSRQSRYCDGYAAHPLTTCSESTIKTCLEALNENIRSNHIDAIVPSGIWATYFLANVFGQVNALPLLPLPDPELIYRFNNKWSFFQLLKGLDSPRPKTYQFASASQISELYLEYPVIIKPTIGGNSCGVSLCQTAGDVEAYLLSSSNQSSQYLIQSYIEGKDAVFGFLAYKGEIKAWTLHVKEERFLRFISNSEILREAEKIVSAMGYSGAGNLDLMIEEATRNFYFLECNPRIWASFGISCAYGVDFINIGNQLIKNIRQTEFIKTCVTEELEVPYPSTGKFLRGWLLGPYSLLRGTRTDFAWRILCDPLPTFFARLQTAKGREVPDDTEMLEMYHQYLDSAK
jgi:glutathione synthase/RimK-type ligase-like ATP-grasp enzyme